MAEGIQAHDYNTQSTKSPLELGLRLRLSFMMFLQFAVWGAWYTVYSVYMGKPIAEGGLGFRPTEVGSIYGMMAVGAMISTMFVGQIADSLMATERLLGLLHITGAALMIAMARSHTFAHVWWFTFAYALTYNPTLALANSLAFANVKDATRDFPTLRVLGTIGWIASGLTISYILPSGAQATNKPLYLSAGCSLVLAFYTFALPHTPPSGKRGELFPFLRALKLLLDPQFGLFFAVSLFVTIALTFYFPLSGPFFADKGVTKVAAMLTIGQASEIIFMLLLPLAVRKLGMKGVLLMGMGAWAVRYFAFSIGGPLALLLFGLALHGICFDFFLAAGFIHTENTAPASIRSSAQSLYTFLNYGIGMWTGSIAAGFLKNACTNPQGVVNWTRVWFVPGAAAAIAVPIFYFLWRGQQGKLDDESDKQLDGEAKTVAPLIE